MVVEAHAVLSDPRRRERYDLGEDEDGTSDSMRGAGGMPPDLANLFAQFGGAGGGGFSFSPGGSHSHGFHHGF